MKKALCMIALAAVFFGSTASAITPVKALQDTTKKDTTKMKIKKKNGKTKVKTKTKDTTKM
jgi:outer membrane lipoprotein SlyB